MPKHNQFIKNIKSQFVSINNTLESYFNELKFFIKNLRRSKFSKNSKAFLILIAITFLVISYYLLPTLYNKDLIQLEIKNQIYKKYNMKNVIAFPHLNIKEWDLRMFNDLKLINKNDEVFYYLPKIICAISELNFKFLSKQYKHNVEIKKVESLRFLKYANLSFEELIYKNFLNASGISL